MNIKIAIGVALVGAMLLGATVVGWSSAQSGKSEPASDVSTGFSDLEEGEIRNIVRAYLLEHPEVIIEAVNVYSERQRAAAQAQALDGARANLAALLDEKTGFITGADKKNAKIAVIEMFDYHCGYCKRAVGSVQELAKSEDVMVVFRELPILRPESDIAAEMALAAREQGKFLDLHFAMMNAKGVLSKERIKDIAKSVGINAAKLETASKKPSVANAIDTNQRLAQELGVDGTPAFIIASLDGSYLDVMSGYHEATLKEKVAAARAAVNERN